MIWLAISKSILSQNIAETMTYNLQEFKLFSLPNKKMNRALNIKI